MRANSCSGRGSTSGSSESMANWTMLPLVALLVCVWALVALTWSSTGPGMSWTAVLVGVAATSVVARSVLKVLRGPSLQGTWWGELDSNYVDPASGTRLGPITVAVVVRQSWTDPHCANKS